MRAVVVALLAAVAVSCGGGGGGGESPPPGTPTPAPTPTPTPTPTPIPTTSLGPATVTISWDANRESGVNRAGGGYQVSVSGQPTRDVPYASGSAAPTSTVFTLSSGTYTVSVRAYAALDAQGGTTRTFSAASQSLVFVP